MRTGRGARRRTAQDGFTFVELAVTVIMIGLLAALVIPAFLGVRDKADGATAQSLLRTGASALEAAAAEEESFAGLTPGALASVEPTIAWMDVDGAEARADQISVTALGPDRYTLTTRAGDGTAYVLAKDRSASPTVIRTCGPGCTW